MRALKLLTLLLCMVLLTACTQKKEGGMHAAAPTQAAPTPTTVIKKYTVTQPLLYRNNVYNVSDVSASYPIFYGSDTAETVNYSVFNWVKSYMATEVDSIKKLDYEITCNVNGILSLVFRAYSSVDSKLIDIVPFNYELCYPATFKLCTLFSAEVSTWRTELPAKIQKMAQDKDMLLLRDIEPLSDDRTFYLTQNSLVIVYGLYEISGYSQGVPCFTIPFAELTAYVKAGGIISAISTGR